MVVNPIEFLEIWRKLIWPIKCKIPRGISISPGIAKTHHSPNNLDNVTYTVYRQEKKNQSSPAGFSWCVLISAALVYSNPTQPLILLPFGTFGSQYGYAVMPDLTLITCQYRLLGNPFRLEWLLVCAKVGGMGRSVVNLFFNLIF